MGCAASAPQAAAAPSPAAQPAEGAVKVVTSAGRVDSSQPSDSAPLKAAEGIKPAESLPEYTAKEGALPVVSSDDATRALPQEAVEDVAKEAPSAHASPPPEAPVRLLLAGPFSKFTEAVPCYENLPEGSFVDVPTEEYEARYAADAAVISWRWMRPKPKTQEAALDPGANPVPTALVEYVSEVAREENMKYLWLDWSCAPQYPEDLAATMREINRSGKYYATARGFYIWCFASRVTQASFEHSDYFYRAWTLSERLHRAKTKGALKAKDFLPSFLRGLFGMELKPVDEWGPPMAQLAGKAAIALMGGGGRMSQDEMLQIADMAAGRYPMLSQVAARIDGPFRTLLQPHVRAAMRGCVTLRAICEWIERPDDDLDDMTQACGLPPLAFKQMLLHGATNATRMSLNNFRGELNSMLEDAAGLVSEVGSGPGAAEAFLKPVGEMWSRALEIQTTESAVSPTWLRRYLVFEAGCSYKAFSAIDLLFAIYKLFGIEDHSYGQEDALYSALLEKSTASFMSDLAAEPYGWLKELAAISSDEEDVVSSQLATVKNSRSDAEFSVSPGNFGIFFMPSASPPSGSLTPDKKATLPGLFGGVEYSDVVTMVVGFRMDSAAQWGLKSLCEEADEDGGSGGLGRVSKEQGGDIDSHLSLRGRKALGLFEDRLHAAVAAQMSEPWEDDCGLFVVVRYGTSSCITKAVVLRASCGGLSGCPEDADGAEWTVEHVAAFGSEAMKGSSWGISQSLDMLCLDVASCGGQSTGATASFGDCSAMMEDIRPDEDMYESGLGEETPWFSGWKVAFAAGAEPVVSTDPPPMLAPLSAMDSDLLGSDGDDDTGLGDDDDNGEEIEVPEGKTTMQDSEIELVKKSYSRMVAASFSADSMMVYYNILARNYVHDSVMAANLGYFTRLCDTYTLHLESFGEIILTQGVLKQKFEYLAEDLGDAIADADDESLKDSATAALGKLSDLIEACS